MVPPPLTFTTGPWLATPAELSSGEVSASPTAALRGPETVTLTGPAGDPVSGADLISELCVVNNYQVVLRTVGFDFLKTIF